MNILGAAAHALFGAAIAAAIQEFSEHPRIRSSGFITHNGHRHTGVAKARRAARKRRNVLARSAKR